MKSVAALVYQVIPLAAASVVGLIGSWRLTSPAPGADNRTPSRKTSDAARWIIALCCIGWWALLAAERLPDVVPRWLFMVLWASLWPIGFCALLTQLRELALRMPDAQLAQDTRIAVAGAIVLNVFFGIWLFFLIRHYRKHLGDIARQAKVRGASP